MPDAPVDLNLLDYATLQRMALERVRFERLMGMEFLPRVQRAPIAVAHATPTMAAKNVAVSTPVQRPAMSGRELAQAQLAAAKSRVPISGDLNTDKTASWKALEEKARACTACALAQGRMNVVFGTGNKAARLVFVGEGPGQDEDIQGEPFVGKAGQLLNKIIGAMGLRREDVYICNVVKCRPPGNRAPLPDEVAACNGFLTAQLELIAPQAIVALGGPAAKTLLNTVTGISQLRGRWHVYKGIPVMPTFHPAFVLRQYTEEVRGQVWSDMKQVMAKLAGTK